MRDFLGYLLQIAVPTATVLLAMVIWGNHPTGLQILALTCVGAFIYGAVSEALRLLRPPRRIDQPIVDRSGEHRQITDRR